MLYEEISELDPQRYKLREFDVLRAQKILNDVPKVNLSVWHKRAAFFKTIQDNPDHIPLIIPDFDDSRLNTLRDKLLEAIQNCNKRKVKDLLHNIERIPAMNFYMHYYNLDQNEVAYVERKRLNHLMYELTDFSYLFKMNIQLIMPDGDTFSIKLSIDYPYNGNDSITHSEVSLTKVINRTELWSDEGLKRTIHLIEEDAYELTHTPSFIDPLSTI